MIHPTIHMNGTSKKSLIEDWRGAYLALMKARDALQSAAPHGRDYYPQGPDAIRIAQNEHRERLLKIQAVMDDLDELSLVAQFPR